MSRAGLPLGRVPLDRGLVGPRERTSAWWQIDWVIAGSALLLSLLGSLLVWSATKPRLVDAGDDPNTFAFLELGGVGVVSVTAHLWGPQIAEMIRLYHEGDVGGARTLHEEQQPSYDLLRIQTNPIPIKAAPCC